MAVGTKCHLDIETFSEASLKQCGVDVYAAHPSTEMLCASYAFDNGPVHCWIPHDAFDIPDAVVDGLRAKMDKGGVIHVTREVPADLRAHVEAEGLVCAHNAAFERKLLNGVAGRRLGFPLLRIRQMICTMAKVAAHSLPQALGLAAKALGSYAKNEQFKPWMLAVSKPRKPTKDNRDTRWTPQNDVERFVGLYDYCNDDVKAERDIDNRVPDLTPYERRVWVMDQEINDRGMLVDMVSVNHALALIDEYKKLLVIKCIDLCGLKPTQTEAIAEWVRGVGGYPITDLQAPTIAAALADPECPKEVRKVLSVYTYHNGKAVSKYAAMARAVGADNRLRGMFIYHGAGTGRWASRIVQLQNMFRGILADPDVAIEMFARRSLELLAMMYDVNPLKILASCIRGMLIPAPGKDLLCVDYAAIEARVLPWGAGQLDILEVFRTHGKVYEYNAAKIYRKAIALVTKAERFIGKVAVLALGYEGGKKAFAKMAKTYGLVIEEEFAEQIKIDWREANPMIVRFWRDLEDCAIAAISNPGKIYQTKTKRAMFKVEGEFLYMRLPSGRRVAYYLPEIDCEGKPTYMGIDTYTRRWCRVKTYGGKLAENWTQAVARDVLVDGMFKLEAAGYPLVGHVHDEPIMEVDEGFGSVEDAVRILEIPPKWAEDLPLGAEGFRVKRYKKG